MEVVIQHMIIPESADLFDYRKMFYHGDCSILLGQGTDRTINIPMFGNVDFYSYFNGCSYSKWKKFTNVKTIKVRLKVKGACEIIFAGYHLRLFHPEREEFMTDRYEETEEYWIEYEYPDNSCLVVGFDIKALSEFTILGGEYVAVVDDSQINEVELSLATTTCRKEEYIKNNVKLLYDDLLMSDYEIANHLTVHIVDNGRTLSVDDFPNHNRIKYHANKNVGGSGGFARGMIESLEQETEATNVLLMDDDVNIFPEAIYRTYMILKLEKQEYRDAFISGAMLNMEDKNIQHEDVGYVGIDGGCHQVKRVYNQEFLWDVLDNEKSKIEEKNMYAAWWYCCIPVKTIQKKGLPLPLFVRGDDVEYGNRCKPSFITMNGICVWHMGFANKFNVPMNHYQDIRNNLISKAVMGHYANADLLSRVKKTFRMHLVRYDYDSASLVTRALEDYLRGPEFIKQDLGEKILKENNKLSHEYLPIEDLGYTMNELGDPYFDPSRRLIDRILYKLTYNGQRFFPKCNRENVVSVPYNDVYTPTKTAFQKKLIAFNPITCEGYLLEVDRTQYKKVKARFNRALRSYRKNNERIMKEYADAREQLTSMAFWKEYLGI